MDETISHDDLFATDEGTERTREFALQSNVNSGASGLAENTNVIVEDNGLTDQAFEQSLVTQFIKLLGMRHKQSVLLSDLGALMNEKLRLAIKDKGGLRTWVQKYSNHFSISGHPGKEHVSLVVPGNENDKENIDGNEENQDSGNQEDVDGNDENMSAFDMQPILQLRGLPYRAQYEDIVNFLGTHAHFLKPPKRNSVQLVLNRDGRPSGFARVHFSSAEAAKTCKELLHMQPMEERYVEVFLYNNDFERLSKKKKDDKAAAQAMAKSGSNEVEVTSNKEEVVIECIRYLKQQGKGVLLSMLGVALSQASRMFLKQTDQGLKHFLADVPELSVEGTKGCECVCFIEDSARRKQSNGEERNTNVLQEKTIFPNAIPPNERNGRNHNNTNYGPHTGIPVYPAPNLRMGAPGSGSGTVSSYHRGPPQNLSLNQNIPLPTQLQAQSRGGKGENHMRYQPNLDEMLFNQAPFGAAPNTNNVVIPAPPRQMMPQSPPMGGQNAMSSSHALQLSPPGLLNDPKMHHSSGMDLLNLPSSVTQRFQNTPSNWGTPMPMTAPHDNGPQSLFDWAAAATAPAPPAPGAAAPSSGNGGMPHNNNNNNTNNNTTNNILGAAAGGPMWPSPAVPAPPAQWDWASATPSVWNGHVNPPHQCGGAQLDPDSLQYAPHAQHHLQFSSSTTHPHISPETFDWSAHVPPPSTNPVIAASQMNHQFANMNMGMNMLNNHQAGGVGSNFNNGVPIGAPASSRIQREGAGATVRLRGLPFTSFEDDVLTFFAQHDVVQRIAPVDGAVRMEVKPNGKPAGTAIVQLNSPEDMQVVKDALNDRWIGGRYIEVFTENEYKNLSMNYKNNDAGWPPINAQESGVGKDQNESAGNGITEDALAKFNLENEETDSKEKIDLLVKMDPPELEPVAASAPKSEEDEYEDDMLKCIHDQ